MGGGGSRKPKKQIIYMDRPSAPQPGQYVCAISGSSDVARSTRSAKSRQERAAREADEKQRRDSAFANLGSYVGGIETQLRSGLISYEDATTRVQDYESTYGLQPGATSSYVQNLTDIYTTDIRPGRQERDIKVGFQELMGREATDKELVDFKDRGYKTLEDVRTGIRGLGEYQKKFNDNYLDNYYDVQYGDQIRDEEGNLTGQRTFKFNEKYMPSYSGDLEKDTGIKLPEYGDMTGSVQELEEFQQGLRQNRQYLYSAGLTNLQGDIDKSLQKIKNTGAVNLQKAAQRGSTLNSLIQSFSF